MSSSSPQLPTIDETSNSTISDPPSEPKDMFQLYGDNFPSQQQQRKPSSFLSQQTPQSYLYFFLNQIKCIVITVATIVLLLVLMVVCFVIWSRKHNCLRYEDELNRWREVRIPMKELWNEAIPQQELSSATRDAIISKLKSLKSQFDDLYLSQRWEHNLHMREQVKEENQCGGTRTQLYEINGGPWNVLNSGKREFNELRLPEYEHNEQIPETQPHGAAFYPEDMTKEEFTKFVHDLGTDEEKKQATGFYTTIERSSSGSLTVKPYSEAYNIHLDKICSTLLELAPLLDSISTDLGNFVRAKEKAFRDNKHSDADVAWLELDRSLPLDITLGFYETYEDQLFGYKASAELYVSVVDKNATNQVQSLSSQLQWVEDSLPIDDEYKRESVSGDGQSNPISVVNMLLNGGDAAFGVQTAAYNLPNDASIISTKGSKRIMLRNVQESKFKHTLLPLVEHVLTPTQTMYISFDAFFTSVLSHELMHGLGPHEIPAGRGSHTTATTVRAALKECYSPLEEAKADISGLFMLTKLIQNQKVNFVFDFEESLQEQKGINYAEKLKRSLYVTYLTSMFRSARFGTQEAHGKAVTVAFNYLQHYGGIVSEKVEIAKREEGETVLVEQYIHGINFDLIETAIESFVHDVMTIQALGDYEGAKRFLEEYSEVSEMMGSSLEKISEDDSIAVDIRPVFV